MALPNPVIFVPGITATYLRDLYPLPPDDIWTLLRKDFERAQMHPDNPAREATQPALVRPDHVFEIAYKELIEELRYNLTERPDRPVPVFPFGYDWRQPLSVTEADLEAFIDDVIARTSLMRHYYPEYLEAPKVNLVAHSMGGLVVAGYVDRFGTGKIDRIATLATPYHGSFEAIVKMATGTANIGGQTPSSREREAARVTPSLYHLLPEFDSGILTDPADGLPTSTFDPGLWQPSIVDTITDYVHRYGRDTPSRDKARQDGPRLFDDLLGAARDHRARTNALDLAAKGFSADRWLCVIGADTDTRVRMTVKKRGGDPQFLLTSGDRLNEWEKDDPDEAVLSGDGTVHFRAAIPPFLPRESLVCVTPHDYGYWELQDKVTTRLAGFHGILPNMNMLHRMLVRFFTGRPDPKGNTWGRAAPGVSQAAWEAATPLKLKWKERREA